MHSALAPSAGILVLQGGEDVKLPYGKFAHGIFRGAALLKWAIEKRHPNRLQLGAD